MDLLTASWRQNDQLQQWDARNNACELNETLDWDGIKLSNVPCFLYTCQFSKKHQDMIIAGGSNSNEVKLFDKSSNNKPFCAIYNLPREIDTVDFSYDDSMFAISGADGYVRVFSISEVWSYSQYFNIKSIINVNRWWINFKVSFERLFPPLLPRQQLLKAFLRRKLNLFASTGLPL